jgi:O-antigen/teichoic acid export membrane protein
MGRVRKFLYPLIYGGRYRWPFESRLKGLFDLLGVWTLQRRLDSEDRERMREALRSGRWLMAPEHPADAGDAAQPQDAEYASSRRIARNAILRSAGEVVAKLGSAAFFIAMARELAPADFGDFNFVFSLTTVLMFASGFGTEDLIVRDIARDRSQLDGYLTNIMILKLGTSIALLFAALGIVTVAGYGSQVQVIVFLVGGGVALQSFQRTLHSVFQAYERMGLISIALIIERMVTAGVGILVLVSGGRLVEASAVFFGGAVIGFCAAAIILYRRVVAPRWAFNLSRWLPLTKAAIPIGMSSVFFILLLKLDQTLLGLIKGGPGGNAEVGYYGAAFRLIETTMFLSWAFGGAILPWLSRNRDSSKLALGYELGLKGLVAVLMPIGVAYVVLAGPIVHLLYGSQYDQAILPLQLLGMMTVFYGINSMAVITLIACHKPGVFTRIVLVVSVVNVTLNLLLIPRFGADGAAFSALLSSTLLGVLSIWRTSAVVGRIRLFRTFAGPVAGGLAMSAVVLLPSESALPAAVAVFPVYLLGLAVFEWFTFRDDLRMGIEVLGARRRQPTVRMPLLSEL